MWANCVACMGENRKAYGFCLRELGLSHLEETDMDERNLLK